MKDLDGKVDGLKADISEVRGDLEAHIMAQDNENAESLRSMILAFASSVSRGESHTQGEFEQIIRAHDRYLEICEKIGKQNGYTEMEYRYILEEYQTRFHDGNACILSRKEKNHD